VQDALTIAEASEKFCTKCERWQSRTAFFRDRSRPDGLFPWCKECQVTAISVYRKTDQGKRMRSEEGRRYHRTIRGRQVVKAAKRRFYQTKAGRAELARTSRRQREQHPDRYAARQAVNRAVAQGSLIRPDQCGRCGRTGPEAGGRGRIEGHHHMGYAPEYWLDVLWLCHPCHDLADGVGDAGRKVG
jgi:hypothetical protein